MVQDIKAPTSDDFISIFGCDYLMDCDLNQQYIFEDQYEGKLRLTFGRIDDSFGLSFWQNECEVLRIYDERLFAVSINEEEQTILVNLGNEDEKQEIEIVPWPKIKFSIQYLELR